jgi:hypothetical protein
LIEASDLRIALSELVDATKIVLPTQPEKIFIGKAQTLQDLGRVLPT